MNSKFNQSICLKKDLKITKQVFYIVYFIVHQSEIVTSDYNDQKKLVEIKQLKLKERIDLKK